MKKHNLLVFISYARKDGSEYAAKLDENLQAAGFHTWRDIRDIQANKDFTAEIENAIDSADFVVVCITKSAIREDSFVRREIQWALLTSTPVIVARFEDLKPPIHIINNTWVDFFKDADFAFRKITQYLLGPKSKLGQTHLPGDPYRNYVNQLYKITVDFLDKTVVKLVDLRAQFTKSIIGPKIVEDSALNSLYKRQGLELNASSKFNKSYRTIYEAFNTNGKSLLLLGQPGAGKTITLVAFARDFAVKRLSDSQMPVPVLGIISTWNVRKQLPFAEWLIIGLDLEVGDFSSQIKAGNVLLLLDGLDELPDDETRSLFLESVPHNCPTIITSRINSYSNKIKREISAKIKAEVTLLPLSDKQIQSYLANEKQLLESIREDENLHELLRTPLIISLFAYGYRESWADAEKLRDLKKSPEFLRDKIIGRFVEERYKHEMLRSDRPLPFTLDEIYTTLGRIAIRQYEFMDMHKTGPGIDYEFIKEPLDPLPFSFFKSIIPIENARSFMLFVMQLNYIVSMKQDIYQFSHAFIRDYFAFNSCVHILFDDSQDRLLRGKSAVALADMKDMRAIEPLLKALTDEDFFIRGQAARGLYIYQMEMGLIRDERYANGILKLMGDPDEFVRGAAMQNLRWLSDQGLYFFGPLVSLLKTTHYWRARHSIAWFIWNEIWPNPVKMKKMIGKDVLEMIWSFRDDNEPDIRFYVARLLGLLGDKKTLKYLKELCSDKDETVRAEARKSLKDSRLTS